MTEREYMRRFAKIMNTAPGVVFRVLPDSGIRGHKKPYDAFMIYKGRHYSIEAKAGANALEAHQITALAEDMDAGASAYVLRFSRTGFDLIGSADGGLTERLFSMTWASAKVPISAGAVAAWMSGVEHGA